MVRRYRPWVRVSQTQTAHTIVDAGHAIAAKLLNGPPWHFKPLMRKPELGVHPLRDSRMSRAQASGIA